jgi:hypothetical protein
VAARPLVWDILGSGRLRMPERPIHIEIVDEEMARHLRTESGAERLRIASAILVLAHF